jgi:hypothetical protein
MTVNRGIADTGVTPLDAEPAVHNSPSPKEIPMFKTRLLAAALFVAAPLAAQAELIVNGSFEAEVINAGSWTVLPSLTGWSADASSGVELRNAVAGTAHQGANFVELDTNGGRFGNTTFDNSTNSSIWQTVATQAGQTYDLSWAYSPRSGVAAPSNDILVYWNNTLLSTNTGSGVGNPNHVWTVFKIQVSGTGSDTLRFAAGGAADSLGGSLDSVSMTAAVPEPGTYVLMLVGLAAVGFMVRCRTA